MSEATTAPWPESGRGGATAAREAASDLSAAQFDVFLSYTSSDRPLVEALAAKLQQEGLTPWLDRWYVGPGQPFEDDLAKGLTASAACAVFIGAHGLAGWAAEELRVAQNRAATDRAFRVIPVLLPGADDPFYPSSLPPFLATRAWADLRAGIGDAVEFERLVRALKGLPPSQAARADDQGGPPPYRGLEYFDVSHAEYFFGRDVDVQRVLEKLHKGGRFLAVLGPSGSGKSSLVRAGLLAALHQGGLAGSANWSTSVITPRARPLESLAVCLAGLKGGPEIEGSIQRHLDNLRQSSETLHLAVHPLPPLADETWRAVLVCDQFEEILTLCDDGAERSQFLANVLHAATEPGGRWIIVLTLRTDFYARFTAYPEIGQQIADHQYLVGAMSPEHLREVIDAPALRAGIKLETGLADAVLQDVSGEPGALPLLEDALRELWDHRDGPGLTLQSYQRIGRVTGALAKRAEAAYAELTPELRALAEDVLLRLTVVAEPGSGAEDTRRRATLSELVTSASPRQRIDELVARFTNARLLISGSDPRSGTETVEVAHEALIRHWPRFRGWVAEERVALVLRQRAATAAADWRAHNRDESFLFVGSRLSEIQADLERNPGRWTDDERAFVDASQAYAAAVARGRYLRSVGAVAGQAVGTGLGFGAAFTVVVVLASTPEPAGAGSLAAGFLLIFALNLFTGLGIGLGLRVLPTRRAGQAIASGLIGGLLSFAATLVTAVLLIVAESAPVPVVVAAGAWLGAGLGVGAAIGRSKTERFVSIAVGGLLGTMLADLTSGMQIGPAVACAAGLVLGGVTGAAYWLTSVDDEGRT